MEKENKIHLEGAKVYGPQDYEVVDELKKVKEEKDKLKIRIYKNIDGDKWQEYQEFCRKNNI